MRSIGFVSCSCLFAAAIAAPRPAAACGGFFCDNVDPVVQTAERILFRVGDGGTVRIYVELQYQGAARNFAWVLPIPEAIATEAIEVAPAGLFDELERLTAPVFYVPEDLGEGASQGHAASSGCGFGLDDDYGYGDFEGDVFEPDTTGVKVVGEAVVGPYAIEIITAESGENLTNWLQLNGYQIPFSAATPMEHYVDLGMAFVGVKLRPDLPSGPIDTLVLEIPGNVPSIPVILTAIAAVENMEIVAYVLARSRYVPGNWTHLDFDYGRVRFSDPADPPDPDTGTGGDTDDDSWGAPTPLPEDNADATNYETLLVLDIEAAGGRAWNTEFAQPTAKLVPVAMGAAAELLATGDYLARMHTFVSPGAMTVDPYFERGAADLTDVDNAHAIEGEDEVWSRRAPWTLPVMGLLIPAVRIRRRRG